MITIDTDHGIFPIMVFSADDGIHLNIAVIITEENAEAIADQVKDVEYFSGTDRICASVSASVEKFDDKSIDEYYSGESGLHIRLYYCDEEINTDYKDIYIPYGHMLIEDRGRYDQCLTSFDTDRGICDYFEITPDEYKEYVKSNDFQSAYTFLSNLTDAIADIHDDVLL